MGTGSEGIVLRTFSISLFYLIIAQDYIYNTKDALRCLIHSAKKEFTTVKDKLRTNANKQVLPSIHETAPPGRKYRI
jgi:hypothetical protein